MSVKFSRANAKPPTPKINARPWIIVGLLGVTAIFGVLGSWAATASIASAVIASGSITVDGKRKQIQHLEGGIVKNLAVQDGDVVTPGQTLVMLDPTRAKAQLAVIETALDRDLATEARLVAERDGNMTVSYSSALTDRAEVKEITALMKSQTRLFEARREALQGEVEILRQREGQLAEEITGLDAQREAKVEQIALITEELKGLKDLLDRGRTTRPRVLALQRNATALKGEEGELIAAMARAKKAIGETKLQIIQRQRDFQKTVTEELQQVQAQLRDLRERAIAARDVLKRIEITAPLGGTVVNMAVHTIGAVIKPGETIMEIVPGKNNLIAEVMVRPQDIDNVTRGQDALIRVLAFKQRTAPLLHGQVNYVSADSLTDEATKRSYYVAHIEVPEEEIKKLGEEKLKPGMQVEVMIQTGMRTAFQYLLQPMIDSMNRALREE